MPCSSVSLGYNTFEQGPFSFIELLFYVVGLVTFTFLLSFHLESSICHDAEQGPLSLLLFYHRLRLCLDLDVVQ